MLFLIGGLITNFLSINQPQYFRPTLILLAIGFTLAILSSNLVNTWVREPRADQVLTATLKKFGNDYVLFHYTTSVPHVLLTPSRLYVIVTKRQSGQIMVKGDRISRKFTFIRLLRFFADESLGSPVTEAQGRVKKVSKLLSAQLAEEEIPEIMPLVIFVHKEVELLVSENPSIPVMRTNELKSYLREHAKHRAISAAQRNTLVNVLGADYPETSKK